MPVPSGDSLETRKKRTDERNTGNTLKSLRNYIIIMVRNSECYGSY